MTHLRLTIGAILAVMQGCESPCRDGFARANDGMCDTIISPDLDGDSAGDSWMTGLDTADPEAPPQGSGTISVVSSEMTGWQYHAYVLQAYPGDKHFAEAAMCVIMLNEPHVVTGQLMSWNPIYEFQTICSVDSPDAEVHTFAPGEVTLRSYIYAGEGASPSACGEVVVTVDGDIEIPAPAVGDCP